MKVEILYFSGTGNTWWVAERLAGRLNARGAETRLIAFETKERKHLPSSNTDLFGLAFPTYGTGAPINVDDYLHETRDGEGKKCFVITTFAAWNGSTACDAAGVLEKRGFDPVLACGIKMPMNVWLPMIKVWPIPKPPRAETIKTNALPKIDRIAEYLCTGKRFFRRRDPVNRILSRAQYLLFYQPGMQFVNRMWSADDKCTRCRLCERICPRANIEVTKDRVEFRDKCMLCMRCYSFCPEEAVQFMGKTQDYYRYPGVGSGYEPQTVEYI